MRARAMQRAADGGEADESAYYRDHRAGWVFAG